MTQFSVSMKELRAATGMTLDQVAKKIKSHKGYVSGIENGKVNPPSLKFLKRFAVLYGTDFEALVLQAYIDKAPEIIKAKVVAAFSDR